MKRLVTVAILINSSAACPDPKYAAMAPIEQYRETRANEIALARSAAPPSVSADAEILVLGKTGYIAGMWPASHRCHARDWVVMR